jgi:hypothetical protein
MVVWGGKLNVCGAAATNTVQDSQHVLHWAHTQQVVARWTKDAGRMWAELHNKQHKPASATKCSKTAQGREGQPLP